LKVADVRKIAKWNCLDQSVTDDRYLAARSAGLAYSSYKSARGAGIAKY
jgi:hypothetical protein